MGFDIKLTFPKTPPTPKEQILRRTGEIKKTLSAWPRWLIGKGRQFLVGCTYPDHTNNIPHEFTRSYYKKGPHDFKKETRLSSKVELTPYFLIPDPNTKIGPLQLFKKTKDRIDLKQVWEYLTLDLWSRVLRYYSQCSQITLQAPVAIKIENQTLLMSYCSGTIADLLHEDFQSDLKVSLANGDLTLYQAFALHLGALARIKEAEELKHGDYTLRHIIFDPGKLIDNFYYYSHINDVLTGRFTFVNHFLTKPSLSVIDIEHGLRAPRPEVEEENKKLLWEARNYTAGHGLKPQLFEKYYRDGYDLIQNQSVTQSFVDAQYQRWGFSVDTLF